MVLPLSHGSFSQLTVDIVVLRWLDQSKSSSYGFKMAGFATNDATKLAAVRVMVLKRRNSISRHSRLQLFFVKTEFLFSRNEVFESNVDRLH